MYLGSEAEFYAHIALTEAETAAALHEARKAKYFLIERQKYLEKLSAPAYPVFTHPRQYHDWMVESSGLTIDSSNELIFKKLLSYFYGIKTIYTEGLDFNKGLMVFGNVGVGKTTLMKAFMSNPRASFLYADTLKIVNEYAADGVNIIESYSTLIPNPNRLQKYFGNEFLGICFDDLGTETTGVNFGNKKNVMGEILLMRYANCPGPYTHVTTNNTLPEFLDVYGLRVVDRMREMFNLIEFPEDAKSRRG